MTETTHLKAISADPSSFGTTTKEIKRAYERWGEPFGFDGRARREIVLKAFREGWIRVRCYGGNDPHWAVEFAEWNLETRRTVDGFIRWAVKSSKIMSIEDEVRLVGVDDGYRLSTKSAKKG